MRVPRKIRDFTFSTACFLSLLLSSTIAFLWGDSYWWLVQLSFQLLLCIVGLFIPTWRVLAGLFLGFLIYSNWTWFPSGDGSGFDCSGGVLQVSGEVRSHSFQATKQLQLIKVQASCGPRIIIRPIAQVALSPQSPRKGWFQVGHRIQLRNITLSTHSRFALSLVSTARTRVSNLSNKEKYLRRNSLLLYVQRKAAYYLQSQPYGFYRALVTADQRALSREWKQRIRILGIAHLFAISGLHVGILYLWLTFLFRWIFSYGMFPADSGIYLLAIDLISLCLIAAYLQVIGMPISALRSLLMLIWWVTSKYFFPWQPLGVTLLSVACLILVGQPLAIGQVSFQLSFLSVAGILVILPFLPSFEPQNNFFHRLFKLLVSSLLLSLWLFLLTLPIVHHLMQDHSILAVATSLLHIAFLSYLFLPYSIFVLAITVIGFPLYQFPGEFYFYSLLNFLGRLWEWLLLKNAAWNQEGIIHFDWQWSLGMKIIYWLTLLGLLYLSRFLMRTLPRGKIWRDSL